MNFSICNMKWLRIPVAIIIATFKPVVYAAMPLESKTAPLPELLEYVMKGITNRPQFLSLNDKQTDKYILILTALSAQPQPTNSPLLYLPWRLLLKTDTNNSYRLISAGSSAEFTMSLTNGNPKNKFGMPDSSFPRGTTNWSAIMDVRLWANKELGDCEVVLHLHTDGGDTNYVLLTAKADGSWIIIETRKRAQYAGYYDRGDASYIVGGKNDPNRGLIPNAPKPMAYDPVSKFEDFYGKTEVINTQMGEVRIWRKDDFIISYIDDKTKRQVVAVEKVGKGGFNQAEVFELAERYCGKQEWILDEKDEKWSVYSTKDRKFSLTWTHKDQRVSLQYYPVSEQLKKF